MYMETLSSAREKWGQKQKCCIYNYVQYIYIYIYIYNMQCMQLFSMHTLSEKKAHKLSLYRCPFKRYKYVLFGYKYTFLVVICI